MLGLGYIDCHMTVLGTQLYRAKEKIGTELRYARYKTAVTTDKVTSKVKSGVTTNVEKVKEFGKDKFKSKKEEAAEETAKTTEEAKAETVSEEKVDNTKAETVSEEKVDETKQEPNFTEEVIYGPDFTPLQGVYYDPDPAVSNFVKVSSEHVVTGTLDEEETSSRDEDRPVTQEDIDKALAKMRGEGK